MYFSYTALAEMQENFNFESSDIAVFTADNVRIKGEIFENNKNKVIIYSHSLIGSGDDNVITNLLNIFGEDYDLITFDFRGHRSSFKISSTGGDEILDLREVISFAYDKGYEKVVVLGIGMGGCVALRTAEIFKNINALIVVSPSGFTPEFQPFLVKIISDITLNTDFGKLPLKVISNTRIGSRYSSAYPNDIIKDLSQIPFLLLQSENDRYVNFSKLYDAFSEIKGQKEIVVTPGNLHGDKLLTEENLIKIKTWLKAIMPEENRTVRSISEEEQAIFNPGNINISLKGDMPVPEELIIEGLNERLSGTNTNHPEVLLSESDILETLGNVLSYHGYSQATLSMENSGSSVEIEIMIPQINSVIIEGNKWISNDYIQKILRIDGDYFNSYELDTAIRRLSAEPAINTVRAETIPTQDGSVNIVVKVNEQRAYRLLLSTKFTDIDKFYSAGFSFNEYNPPGFQIEAKAMVGVFNKDVLSEVRIAKSFWDNNLRFYGKYFNTVKSRDDLDYIYTRQEVQETGGAIAAGYQFSSTIDFDLGIYEKDYKTPKGTLEFPIIEGTNIGNFFKLNLGGMLPLQGEPRFLWRHTFYYQNSGLNGSGDFDFSNFQLNFSGDLKLWRRHRSVSTIHYGWINGAAPPQEYFSLGGMTTLPAYEDDSFINTRMIRASQALYISAENWFDETSKLAPLCFISTFGAGTVWDKGESFDYSDLKMNIGFELEYYKVLRLGISSGIGPHRVSSPRIYIGWGTHVF
ncbi:alpha/beta fold hydrolase [candidate division KSB1 bacterium]